MWIGYCYLLFIVLVVVIKFFDRNFARRKVDNIRKQYRHTKNNNVKVCLCIDICTVI